MKRYFKDYMDKWIKEADEEGLDSIEGVVRVLLQAFGIGNDIEGMEWQQNRLELIRQRRNELKK